MEDQRRMCKGSLFAYFAWSSITGLHSAHRTRRALLQVGWDKDIMWQCCQCYFNFHLVFVLPSHRPWLRTTLGLQRSWKQGASLHAYCSKQVLFPFRVLQLGFPRRDASSFRACITALHQRRLVRYQSWASLVETCQRVTSSDWTVTESQNRHRLPQIANGKSIATGKSLVSHCCQDWDWCHWFDSRCDPMRATDATLRFWSPFLLRVLTSSGLWTGQRCWICQLKPTIYIYN